MICTSIQGKTLEEILGILESGEVEMAEIRLDLCDLDEEEIEELFTQSDVPLIATCRIATLAQRVAAEGDLLDDAGKVLSEQGLYASQPRKGRNPIRPKNSLKTSCSRPSRPAPNTWTWKWRPRR